MSFALPSNDKAPHKAVIFVRAEVHEANAAGECSGRPVYRVKEFPVCIDGADKHICIRKLNEQLEEFIAQCRK